MSTKGPDQPVTKPQGVCLWGAHKPEIRTRHVLPPPSSLPFPEESRRATGPFSLHLLIARAGPQTQPLIPNGPSHTPPQPVSLCAHTERLYALFCFPTLGL